MKTNDHRQPLILRGRLQRKLSPLSPSPVSGASAGWAFGWASGHGHALGQLLESDISKDMFLSGAYLLSELAQRGPEVETWAQVSQALLPWVVLRSFITQVINQFTSALCTGVSFLSFLFGKPGSISTLLSWSHWFLWSMCISSQGRRRVTAPT